METKEEEKKCLFSIQKMNKYYLLPFMVPVVCYFTKFFSEPMKTNGKTVKIDDIDPIQEHKFVFLYQIINSTSLIFGGLLYFYSLIQSKKVTSEEILNTKTLRRSFKRALTKDSTVDYQKKKLKTTFLILFMSIIITGYNIIKGYATKHPQLEKRLYFLFFFTLINVCLFRKEIYSHQLLSLIIGFISMLVIFIAFFYEQFNKQQNNYNYIYDIILFFGSILYSLYLVLFKYITTNMSMPPFLCMLLIGILSTLFTIIGYAVFSYIKEESLIYLNFFSCGDNPDPYTNYVCVHNFYGKIIVYTLLNTLLQVLIFLVVYYFSPEIFAISDIISPFFSYITNCIEGKITQKISLVSSIIAYVIIILISFVYNEIIVCNFCGLNKNTWNAIQQKAVDDYLNNDVNGDGESSDIDPPENSENERKMDDFPVD